MEILRYAPDYEDIRLEKQTMYRYIFGEGQYQDLQLNNVISDLLQLAYRFLANLQLEERELLLKNFTLENLLERGHTTLAKRLGDSFAQKLEKTTEKNATYFYYEYLFHDKMVRHHLSTKMRAADVHLQAKNDSFDLYYLCNKLRMACDMLSRQNTTGTLYQCHFLEEVLLHYQNNFLNCRQNPAFNIYYQLLLLIQEKKEEQYRKLKSYIPKHLHLFPKAELRIIYLYLQNYCIFQINSGKSRYYRELRELYELLLEEGILFQNGFLQQWTYKNIVTVGIRLAEYDWTESIIHQYKSKLKESERPNALAYNLAALYYARKQYKKALRQLHDVTFTDQAYHLGAKIIQLKSYFELNETEALHSLLEAFKKYILRNKGLAPYHKQANANFLRLVKKLYKLKSSRKRKTGKYIKAQVKKLNSLLAETQPIANKDWLLEKMEESFGKANVAPTE